MPEGSTTWDFGPPGVQPRGRPTIDEGAPDAGHAIRLAGDLLRREGVAGTDYVEAVVERESHFPTGLQAPVPFALPHADAPGARTFGVALVVLGQPVPFGRMDAPTECVSTRIVALLSVPDRSRQTGVLKQVISSLARGGLGARVVAAHDSVGVLEALARAA